MAAATPMAISTSLGGSRESRERYLGGSFQRMGSPHVLFLPRPVQSLSHHGVPTWRCSEAGGRMRCGDAEWVD